MRIERYFLSFVRLSHAINTSLLMFEGSCAQEHDKSEDEGRSRGNKNVIDFENRLSFVLCVFFPFLILQTKLFPREKILVAALYMLFFGGR